MLTTSLTSTQVGAPDVVRHYPRLTRVEDRSRVLKDILNLRPVYHWTEQRVRGHIGICVVASVIEALITRALNDAGVSDPDIEDQTLSSPRALRELDRIRSVTLTAGGRTIGVVTRPNALQSAILAALGVDTIGWKKATIT